MSTTGKEVKTHGASAVKETCVGECDWCGHEVVSHAWCFYCKKTQKMCNVHLTLFLASAYGVVDNDMFVMRPCRCHDCETSIERKREAEEAVAKRKEAEAAEDLKKKVTIEERQPDRVAALEAKLDALLTRLTTETPQNKTQTPQNKTQTPKNKNKFFSHDDL